MSKAAFDHLWINARLASMQPGAIPYGAIDKGAIATRGGEIVWVGPQSDLSGPPASLTQALHDAEGCWITPGLIDCHTHLVYGGDRAAEFELRLEGASYEEIAKAGGGIVSTVKATREASEADLVATALPRLDALLAEGVTTIEIKSGYGLALTEECKMLGAARKLGEMRSVTVKTSFLGAHALPPEFEGRQGDYVTAVEAMIPEVAARGLADAVDAFGERIAFTPEEVSRVFSAAKAAGLPVKLHADQLSDQGGAALAAGFGALSADHLEYASEEGLAAMAKSGSIAVLLPGAFYVLRETKLPPIEACRKLGVGMAIATDSNPGSSPVTSILLMLSMASTLFRMTPEESLAGVTREAAKALGLGKRLGTLEVGKQADFCLWEIERPAELAYRVGFNPLRQVVRQGDIRS